MKAGNIDFSDQSFKQRLQFSSKQMESTVCLEMSGSDSENILSVEEVEWMKLKKARFKEGYVDGKYAGTETAKESGEEHGYVKGFEDSFNYTLSMAMGLLGVNQCILRDIESPLLSRAREIKFSLDSFRKKYNAMRMKEVECNSEKCQEESIDSSTVEDLLHDENSNLSSVSTETERDLESCRCKQNSNRARVTHEDLCQLKLEVLDFLNACHQPLILEQMARIFEDLDQLLIESSASNQNHPDLSVSKVLSEST